MTEYHAMSLALHSNVVLSTDVGLEATLDMYCGMLPAIGHRQLNLVEILVMSPVSRVPSEILKVLFVTSPVSRFWNCG
jgi:hypothetical protein